MWVCQDCRLEKTTGKTILTSVRIRVGVKVKVRVSDRFRGGILHVGISAARLVTWSHHIRLRQHGWPVVALPTTVGLSDSSAVPGGRVYF